MLDVSKDIRSLTDFKRDTPKFVDELKTHGRAVILTVNGSSELAVMSATTFQKVLEALDTLDAIKGIQEGLEQAKRGQGRPADEFFAEARKHLRRPVRAARAEGGARRGRRGRT
jgi:PHD/YefM family antitoxin component YafN of YafNO toxin-antitoxin module